MSAQQVDPTLSEDELYLRVNHPKFFNELVDAHTATLVEQHDTEGLTAWKETTEQRNHAFAEIDSLTKEHMQSQQQAMSHDMQGVQFSAAVMRYSADNNIPFQHAEIDREQAAAAYEQVEREEREPLNLPPAREPGQTIGDEPAPKEDLRFVANREIDESRRRHAEAIDPAQHSFGDMAADAKADFMAEQDKVSREAIKAQEQSLQQTQQAPHPTQQPPQPQH